jgi:hypothetical protein
MLVCVSHRVTDSGHDFDDLRQGQSLARAVERFEKLLQSLAIPAVENKLSK